MGIAENHFRVGKTKKERMKKIITIIVVSLITLVSASAQHALSTNLTLYNKVKVKYEAALNDNISLGSYIQYNYGELNQGYKVSPIFRFYPGRSYAPEGFYLQAKVLYGSTKSIYPDWDYDENLEPIDYIDEYAYAGGGIGLGYQTLAGRNDNFVIDIALGFRIASRLDKQDYGNMTFDEQVLLEVEQVKNALIGPSSFFDLAIGFGYKFGY